MRCEARAAPVRAPKANPHVLRGSQRGSGARVKSSAASNHTESPRDDTSIAVLCQPPAAPRRLASSGGVASGGGASHSARLAGGSHSGAAAYGEGVAAITSRSYSGTELYRARTIVRSAPARMNERHRP
eukprot:1970452-Prymnesium_polylepis.2